MTSGNKISSARAAPLSCWVVSEGFVGHRHQGLGLAEALGGEPQLKTAAARQPWRSLPPLLWLDRIGLRAFRGEPLEPPWPDLVVSSGGQGALMAALVRRLSGGRTFAVQVQRPPLPQRYFDVLVAPRHDGLAGANLIETDGALHHVTRPRLREAAARWGALFQHLPRPRVAVLLGGSNNRYRLTAVRMRELAAQLADLARGGAGLMVTPSRRTDGAAARVLGAALAGQKFVIWDGTGDNPYFGLLALADAILVTRDSVSMASEAVFTGKPVHIIPLDGRSRRIERFHELFERKGYTRPFAGALESWHYDPPDETAVAAARIKPLLAARLEGLRMVER